VYCFAFQGNRGLFEPDEGRYSAVALQMIKSNDWLVPHTHPQHEHWTKPPLTYWAIAGSILTFGMNEFAVRFTNVMSFFLCIIIAFYLGKIFVPKRPWLVSLIYGTFLFPATMCNGATTDFLMTMWQALAVCFFAHAFWGKGNKQGLLVFLAWFSFGLAFLTKGPPALLPLGSILLFLQMKPSDTRAFSMRWFRGLLILFLVGGSWFFVVISQKPELLRYFLWDEIVLRVFSSHHQRHPHWYAPLYIYVPILIFGTLPWSYYTGKGFIKSLRNAKRHLVSEFDENNIKGTFLILWLFVPLTIFFISQSNLPLYILPLFIPLSIITSKEIERSNISIYKMRYRIGIWCVFIVLTRILMGSLDFNKDSSKLADQIKQYHSEPVEEFVFVNTPPALGLQFYTGADVKEITMIFENSDNHFESKQGQIWVVLQQEVEKFRQEAKENNIPMKELGLIKSRQDYVLFKNLDGRI